MTRPDKADPFSLGELDMTPDQIARDVDQVSFDWDDEKASARRVTFWTLAAAVLVAAACIAIVWGF